MRKVSVCLIYVLVTAMLVACQTIIYKNEVNADTDKRQFAHGINFVHSKNKNYLIWSDAYQSGTTTGGNWTHDIFYQEISLKNPQIKKKTLLISAPEAQEPVSASAAGDGSILCTFEDGNNTKGYTIAQRYAVYNKDMKPVKEYPNTIKLGGHSGHSAGTEKYHVVFWNYDWVNGGGEDNLGTGKSVHVTTIDTKGRILHSKKVSSKNRNWWPLAAASKKYVMLVWQRYVSGKKYAKLMYAVYDPEKNRFVRKPRSLDRKLKAKYYSFSVSYLPASNQFIIIAAHGSKKSKAYLFSERGKKKYKKNIRGAMVREATPAIKSKQNKISIVEFPASKNKIVNLKVKKNKIIQGQTISSKHTWQSLRIAGFYSSKRLNFAELTKKKVIIKSYGKGK